MKATMLLFPVAAVLATCCAAQEPGKAAAGAQEPGKQEPGKQDPGKPPAVAPDVAQGQAKLLAHLAAGGVQIDLAAKTLTVAAVVNPPADPIEYLLIHQRGKGHEALFVTEVKPSLLNTGLLLLGFENGTNARIVPVEPEPTEAEIEAGADYVKVIPPQGNPLWMSVRWKDDAGAQHELAVDELIVDMTTREPLAKAEWIFLGGRMAPMYRGEPPVFIADFEGNLVSICYMQPENHLVTMRHERARDDQNWWMTRKCPPPGTAVEFRFHGNKPVPKAGAGKAGEAHKK